LRTKTVQHTGLARGVEQRARSFEYGIDSGIAMKPGTCLLCDPTIGLNEIVL